MDHIPLRVGEHLGLDVAWVLGGTLEVAGGVAEELLALPRGALEGILELVFAHRDPEALPATAPGGFGGGRVARLLGLLLGGGGVLDRGRPGGNDRYARLLHDLAR